VAIVCEAAEMQEITTITDEPQPNKKKFIRRTFAETTACRRKILFGESRCLRRFSAEKFLLLEAKISLVTGSNTDDEKQSLSKFLNGTHVDSAKRANQRNRQGWSGAALQHGNGL
jgi:hypothetical protein